jgi:predicted nucleic acid-binding protein
MKSLLITDTSVLLNLLATQRAEEILSGINWQFYVCKNVVEEALVLRDSETQEIVAVDLSALVTKKLLQVLELETDEEFELLADYSALMGKGGYGEAMCFALSESHSLPIAIDDERAVKRAKRRFSSVRVLTTPEILKQWQADASVPQATIRTTLLLIQRWASYYPGPKHPCYDWWSSTLAEDMSQPKKIQ